MLVAPCLGCLSTNRARPRLLSGGRGGPPCGPAAPEGPSRGGDAAGSPRSKSATGRASLARAGPGSKSTAGGASWSLLLLLLPG